MLWSLPLMPAAAAVAVVGAHRSPRLQGVVGLAGLVAALAIGVWAVLTEPAATWRWSSALELTLAVEGFGRVMVVLVPAIAIPIVGYTVAAEDAEGRTRLVALLVAFTAGMLLLVAAADLLTLLIGWELVGVTSWGLIGHRWRDVENPTAGTHAFVTTRLGDLGLYAAAGIALAATGSLAFADLAGAPRPALDVIAAGVVLAAAAKSAQLPFAPWLFSAMAGPTPVSALLHSATLVAAGAYLLVRLAPAFDPIGWFGPLVVAIGLLTALAGGVVAMLQDDSKRLLAASTSAHHGLMFVALGAGSTAAAGAHLVTHAAFKSLLFLAAGVAIHAAGTGRLSGMRLGRALPGTALLSAVGTLSLAAIPPLGGAWSKEQILAASTHASGWIAAGVLLAGLLSAAYAARFQLLAYGPPGDVARSGELRRAGRAEIAALGALATATVALSALWLPGGAGAVEAATAGALPDGAVWELVASVAVVALAVGIAVVLLRRDRLATLGLSEQIRARWGDWLGLPVVVRRAVAAPIEDLARLLAEFDDRVVDAGVRGVARGAALVSRTVERRAEWGIDAGVRAVSAATLAAANGSRTVEERGVDGAVEATAHGVGEAGRWSRRLQTGMVHQYYVIIALGLVAAVAVLALRR